MPPLTGFWWQGVHLSRGLHPVLQICQPSGFNCATHQLQIGASGDIFDFMSRRVLSIMADTQVRPLQQQHLCEIGFFLSTFICLPRLPYEIQLLFHWGEILYNFTGAQSALSAFYSLAVKTCNNFINNQQSTIYHYSLFSNPTPKDSCGSEGAKKVATHKCNVFFSSFIINN